MSTKNTCRTVPGTTRLLRYLPVSFGTRFDSVQGSRRPLSTALIFALASTFTPGQGLLAAPATPADGARWFQVELILFAQKSGDPLEAEQWPDIEGLTLPDNLLELTPPRLKAAKPTGDNPADTAGASVPPEPPFDPNAEPPTTNSPDLPPAYQMLGENQFQLTKMAEQIRRSRKLTPLLHIAWQQPTYDRQHSQPIFFMEGMEEPLPAEAEIEEDTQMTAPADEPPLAPLLQPATEEDANIGPPNPRFVGTVTLSVERYLHLAADLVYRQPVTQHSPMPISDLKLWYDRPYPTLKEPQGPAYQLESWQAMRGFRLKESRRMRSTEIHYLDHPFMGMVVVITPVELPEPAEEIQQTSPQNILKRPTSPATGKLQSNPRP